MIEPLKDLPEGIQGVKASGVVSRTDYTTVIEPMLAEARQAGRRVRFLYEIGTPAEISNRGKGPIGRTRRPSCYFAAEGAPPNG